MRKNSNIWANINGQTLETFLIEKKYELINYFESDSKQTFIILEDGSRFKIDVNFQQLEKVLPSDTFFHCGRFTLININKVKEYWMLDYPFLVMSNGEVLPVQQSDKTMIQKLLLNKIGIRNK